MPLCRREFLRKTAAAATLLSCTWPAISACSGVKRADFDSAKETGGPVAGLDQRHASILKLASLAPSGHNSQPWYVKIVAPNRWIIGADPGRRLPAVDPDNREVMLSLGAFAENLSIAAASHGLRADMRVIAQTSFDPEIIEVALTESAPEEYPLRRLTQRMTVKHGYLPSEIKKQDVAALSAHMQGHLFYFPRGKGHAACIEEVVVESFRIQANRDDAQREFIKWLRLSDSDAETHRDGLTVEGMEIRGFKGWFVRHFVKPEEFLKPVFRRQGVDLAQELARQGGGWFVITSSGNRVSDWVDAGRKFERLALMARERNIAIHPMTQPLEETLGQNRIAASHSAAVIPQFVLRVGYLAEYPDPVSLRRPMREFVKFG
jgi:hypothetical protein